MCISLCTLTLSMWLLFGVRSHTSKVPGTELRFSPLQLAPSSAEPSHPLLYFRTTLTLTKKKTRIFKWICMFHFTCFCFFLKMFLILSRQYFSFPHSHLLNHNVCCVGRPVYREAGRIKSNFMTFMCFKPGNLVTFCGLSQLIHSQAASPCCLWMGFALEVRHCPLLSVCPSPRGLLHWRPPTCASKG